MYSLNSSIQLVDQHFSGEMRQGIPPGKPYREPPRENMPFLMHLYEKNDFGLQTMFFDGFNVLLSFLAETWYRTNMKLPQKASFGPEACKFWPKVFIWGIRRTRFPPFHLQTSPKLNHVFFTIIARLGCRTYFLTCSFVGPRSGRVGRFFFTKTARFGSRTCFLR